MSNLLNTETGRAALYEARNFLLRKRLSRFFKRNLVIDYDRWSHGSAEFDLSTLLGQLNPAHDDEILDLYRLLGTFGGLETSLGDVSIYVDADNGNDQTGTGSSDRPMASLWFVPYLPRKINHFYRIILMSDVDMSGDNGEYLDFDQNIGAGGCLTLAGYGPEEHILSGLDATVTTWTSWNSVAFYLGLTPAATSAVVGKFIQNTTPGVYLGATVPAFYYTGIANGELLCLSSLSVIANDTTRYVQPARLLKVRGLNIRCQCYNDSQETVEDIGARFGILNLRVEVEQGTETNRGSIVVDVDGQVFMSFVMLSPDPGASPGSRYQFMEWRKGGLNWLNLQDISVYDEIGISDFRNLRNRNGAFDCCGVIVDNGSLTNNILTLEGFYGNRIHNMCAMGKLRMIYANATLDHVQAYNGLYESFSQGGLYNSLIAGGASNTIDLFNSHLRTSEVSLQQGNQDLSLQNSELHMYGTGMEPTYGRIGGGPSYHAQLSQGSRIVQGNAWLGMASTVADIRLIDSNPDVTGAWPGTGAQLSDGLQSAVVRPG